MRIPGSSIGSFPSVADATQYKKIRDWKDNIDHLASDLKALDQNSPVDLDDAVMGQVTISSQPTRVGHRTTGRANFNPAGDVQSLDVKGTEISMFFMLDRSTRYQVSDSPGQQRYTTHSWGVSHDLTIDKASGDWNYSTRFLGIPLS